MRPAPHTRIACIARLAHGSRRACRLLVGVLALAVLPSLGTAAPDEAMRAALERLKALREQRPGDGTLAYHQASLHSRAGEKDAALAELRSLVGRQLGLVPPRDGGFDALWDDPDFQQVVAALSDGEARTPDAPVAFRLTDPRLIPEGIAYDPRGRRFFIGSVAGHKIVVRDARGRLRDFSRPADGLDAVLGLAVDGRRRHLLAVSTNAFEDSAKADRRNAVLRYDLARGQLIERMAVPEAAQLNDLAVGADGSLYVTDSEAGSVYRHRPGDSAFTLLGAAGVLRGANGIALGVHGELYVTLSTGVARVDIASGLAQRLPQPDNVATGGIDGLYVHQGDLIGVQNGTNPGRVIRIHLADQGRRIAGVTVLQSHHHPALAEPTTGAIAHGVLHLIANSHVTLYQGDGSVRDEGRLRPTTVLAVPLQR